MPHFSNRQSKSSKPGAPLDDCRCPGEVVTLANEWVDEVHLDRRVGFQVTERTRRPYVSEADRGIVEHDEGGLWRDVGCAIRIDRCDEHQNAP